ncbi:hypothetical protein [Sinorhizobium meliloti]|uniref:hypothetical protein n=1 Tax=Rhizobium meliloti TaxID=382 RepID=UPI002091D611|nr:hypothetical protein [Sinorhizobium meliloti]MCO5965858.1 hypothetical protein [Sinorhizobium meliloti]
MKLRIAAVLAALLTSVSSVSAEELTIRFGHPGTGLDNRQYSQGDATSYARARELIEKEFASDKDIKVEWTYFRGAGPALNRKAISPFNNAAIRQAVAQEPSSKAVLSNSEYRARRSQLEPHE